MNGRQKADAARVGRPSLKVLFITGYAENAILGNGYLAPGMAVLTKPFPVETMAARIRSMVEARRGERERRAGWVAADERMDVRLRARTQVHSPTISNVLIWHKASYADGLRRLGGDCLDHPHRRR